MMAGELDASKQLLDACASDNAYFDHVLVAAWIDWARAADRPDVAFMVSPGVASLAG